jgi:hypothetical protein
MEINIYTGEKVINVENIGNSYNLTTVNMNDLVSVKTERSEFNSVIEALKNR